MTYAGRARQEWDWDRQDHEDQLQRWEQERLAHEAAKEEVAVRALTKEDWWALGRELRLNR